MGQIRDAANATYEDGQSSNPDKPEKSLIRRLFGLIEDIIYGLPQGYDVSYETRAQLYADLNWAAGKIGRVFGDSNEAYIGIYKKSGASGSGSWTRIGPLPGGDVSELQAQVDLLETGKLDNTSATNRILGRRSSGTGAVEQLATVRGLSIDVDGVGLAQMPEATFKGRVAGAGTGAPTDMTVAQARAALNYEADIVEAVDGEAAARLTSVRPGDDGSVVFGDSIGFAVYRFLDGLMKYRGRPFLGDLLGASLAIRDALGFVLYRLSEAGIAFKGRQVLADFLGDSFVIKDSLGFVLLRADKDGISHMGQPLTPATTSPADIEFNRHAAKRTDVRSIGVWQKARAGVVQGAARTAVFCIGDSNMMGWNAGGSSGTHNRLQSIPMVVSKLLGKALSATSENYFGRAIIADAGYETYDPRISVGAGWGATSSSNSLGGEMWVNSTTTNVLGYTPTVPCDTIDVWVAIDAAASLEVGVAGSLTPYTPATGSIVKLTYTAPAVAIQQFQIKRISGGVRLIGWDCYDSTKKGVSVLGGGKSGWRSDDYAHAAGWFSPRSALLSTGASVFVLSLGLNDWSEERAPELFEASMREIIETIRGGGKDVIMVIPMTPNGSRTWAWSEYRAIMYDLAAEYDLPLADIGEVLGTWGAANTAGLVTDNLHPNLYGYGVAASPIAYLLNL
ncbi:SGNH/GDSL hydrolase family protein [Mycoplana rhizolycopersici]|uniref:SGNH/GDSL hydrolase family protein n=1 Tax=Mycoplana rhizolycopersici TaxID=2746702 RepID=A0ABX2QE05_9HYPH|nr:SGNH/GDSL hydrolase family protein [Rhizobium rhizolycopersici]NVP55957.1 SGNH/GDSL hydrolase family protein [Rhizobium rhizolycopersici]